VSEANIEQLESVGQMLRSDRRTCPLIYAYRYYRSRLTRWPQDERDRWRAMYGAFRDRLSSCDEGELARVRVLPIGPLGPVSSVRGEVRIGIAHVLGHIAQIRDAGART
jgi:hypothetical protein